ncbi:ABC transporter permease [Parabacteroides merdae]|uniref:ABC transporter permease n=1 Tax=Parabacteroides merdae TaxID=46503 RepID=UPI0012BC4FA7|nr:FtsX-like permease family protein [Parabacteroides merdae]MTV05090.1 FtsX-like permease family protein [Parabacteroides merdae]
MKNLNIALRSLFKKGRSNGIKILSLGVGLAMGLVLISKVCFERSFDKFYPDSDRIYRLHENIIRDGEYKSYGQVSGGVATAMQVEIPEVEKATRLTYIGGDKELFKTQDGNRYSARYVVMGDTNVFDLLPRPILIGDPKETLSRPGYVMISNRIAKLLGGAEQAVNKEFEFESSPGQTYTIGGVFEDVPENSHLRFEIVASLEGMSKWSRENLLGNDRYLGYVKLYPGTDPESLTTAIREMQGRHCDLEEVKKAGIDLTYSLVPLMDMHSNSDEVKSMNSLLGFLAFVLIFTAAMNYVLIVISTLINRTKEVAVHKCYGASDKNLFGMIMSETCLHMLISLLLAAFLIVLFRTKTEELLGATLGALFSTQTIVILIGVCIVIFFITGLIPTYMFLRIPVAAAFRNFKESRRYWKLCLLFIQFLATAYLVALLSVINKQYDYMVNVDPGYAYEKLAYCSTQGVEESVRNTAIEELRKIPEVDKVSACYDLPISGMSGNNVSLPGDDRELFNIADMYWVKDDFFSLMEIPVIEGEVFRSDGSASNKVMVSRSFVEKMEQVAGWTGSAIGKNIIITEHSQNGEPFTICGVYEDVCIGSTGNPDTRPTALFYDRYAPMILIKFHEMSPENIKKAQKVLEDVMPDRNVTVTAYYMDMIDLYKDSRTFRDSVMIGGIVTLIIALIGLLGYTSDETNRRGREIAIRKVNGATAWSILKMISKDISYIAIPAIVIGMTVAYYSGTGWLEKFTEKAPIGFFIFLAGAMMVYVLIIACVLYRAWAVSNSNPVDSLKSE